MRINEEDKPANIKWYDYIKIIEKNTKKSIICKLHVNDIPEIAYKGEKSLIYINEPLRGKIGVYVGAKFDFEIKKKPKCFLWNWFYLIRYHPDDTIISAIWLGIFAIALGITAIILAVILN